MIVQELVATLGLEVDESTFNRGLLALKGLAFGLAGVGAAVGSAVVGVGALVHGTAEAAQAAANVAAIGGTTVERVQEIAVAAAETGTELHDLSDIFLDLSERALDASSGAGEYADVFRQAGVKVTDSSGKLKPAADLLMDLSDAFAGMTNETKRAALASKLIGEQGSRQLLPIMKRGSAAFKAAAVEAHEYGAVLSSDTVAAAREFTLESRHMGLALTGLRNEIASEVMPDFTALVRVVARFIKENRKLIAAPVIKFMKGLGAAVKIVTENATELQAVLVVLTSFMLARYLTTLQAVTVAQLQWGAAALIAGARAAIGWAVATAGAWLALAPIAAIVAALILLGDELYTFATGGDSLLGRWIKWLDSATEGDGPLAKMLRLFKAVGSVIFDITDTGKWAKLGKAFVDVFLLPFEALIAGVKWLVDLLPRIKVSGVSAEMTGPGAPATPQPTTTLGELFGANSANPAASAAASRDAAGNTYSPYVNAQVEVNVGDGSNPRATGDAVAGALEKVWAPDFSASFVAVDQ